MKHEVQTHVSRLEEENAALRRRLGALEASVGGASTTSTTNESASASHHEDQHVLPAELQGFAALSASIGDAGDLERLSAAVATSPDDAARVEALEAAVVRARSDIESAFEARSVATGVVRACDAAIAAGNDRGGTRGLSCHFHLSDWRSHGSATPVSLGDLRRRRFYGRVRGHVGADREARRRPRGVHARRDRSGRRSGRRDARDRERRGAGRGSRAREGGVRRVFSSLRRAPRHELRSARVPETHVSHHREGVHRGGLLLSDLRRPAMHDRRRRHDLRRRRAFAHGHLGVHRGDSRQGALPARPDARRVAGLPRFFFWPASFEASARRARVASSSRR